MKRFSALLLLFVFLFNVGGYLLLFQYLIYRSDNKISQQISQNNYNRIDLVEVKIPVHMPTVVNWDDYEQISGQMQQNGYYYNYVGLKITRDTMFLLCLPNCEKTRLENADATYTKQMSDSPLNKKANTLLKLADSISKYDHRVVQITFKAPAIIIQKSDIHYSLALDHPFVAINGKPPELTA